MTWKAGAGTGTGTEISRKRSSDTNLPLSLALYRAPLIGLCTTTHVCALYIANTLDKADGQTVTDHELLH